MMESELHDDWKDYKFNATVSGVAAEYSGCGSHRLDTTLAVSGRDDVISLIAQLIPQFVEEGFGANVKEHLERHYGSDEKFMERIDDTSD